MAARGGGRLINISSLAGKAGLPLRTSYCGAKVRYPSAAGASWHPTTPPRHAELARVCYCGAKHAMMGYFDALRVEEHARGSGIAVTNACPGSVRTNVARNAVLGAKVSQPEPHPRHGTPPPYADGARNAVLGAKGVLRGESDANIDGGLTPAFVCERILAAAACDVDEVCALCIATSPPYGTAAVRKKRQR